MIPPGNDYGAFSDFTSETLRSLGMTVKVTRVPKNVVSKYYPEYAASPRYVVIGRMGSGLPVIHFNGHYDVVPAGSGWSRDPFRSKSSGDVLYGRGSADMKGGIASIFLAIKGILESHLAEKMFRGSIEVSLTPDEEIGGHTGVEYMLAKRLCAPSYAVIAEPTGINKILIGHKGALQALIEIYGKSAHGSMPWMGKNTFDAITRVAYVFERQYSKRIKGMKSELHYSDKRSNRPTFMLGGILKGGVQQNLVPSYSAFSVDRRLIPEENLDQAEKELIGCVNAVKERALGPGFRLNLQLLNKVRPSAVSSDSELVTKTIGIVRSVAGRYPELEMAVGTMDAGHFVNKGIQAIAYGPGELYQAHVANEHISLKDVVLASRVYKSLAEEFVFAS